ncbi:hypothetical protein WJX72_010721 [[Myrmecia] bisecta]|uniref:Glycoside hydrolase family 5 domain-containing protein n=1 Tax=[Myrmecia] bisecta TaxID=41462 RepID=A0AAW1Q9W6_9CHLO
MAAKLKVQSADTLTAVDRMARGGWLVASSLAVLLCAAFATAQTTAPTSTTPTLTTWNGQIINEKGEPVILKGVALSGFEIGHTINGNLHQGLDSINQDYQTHIYRMKLLGFNAVRIEWCNDLGLSIPPEDFSFAGCVIASQSDIQTTVTPPLSTIKTPAQLPFAPPTVKNGVCSGDLPNTSTLDRFAYIANLFAREGFYVSLVYHSYSLTADPPGDASIYNMKNWVASWVQLVKTVKALGTDTDGRLILDLINEADTYQATWNTGGQLPYDITTYYLNAMDALYPVCKTCLFSIQGTGQSAGPVNANYGDGYSTAIPDGPTIFFNTVLAKPYLNQVIIAPHVYCPSVTKATSYYQGPTLWSRLTMSFGTLNKAGYCSGTTCHVFAVIIGEFNVNFDDPKDVACYTSLAQYMFNTAGSDDKKHNNIPSFFIWAWDADADLTFGNGGIMATNWHDINWDKVYALTGVERFTQGVNLIPWYNTAYKPLLASDLEATPSPPGAPSAPSGPTVQAIAEGIFNVSGVGVPPLDTKKQGWVINAIRDAVNNAGTNTTTSTSGRRLQVAITSSKATFTSATITSIGDSPATNSSIVVIRMIGTAPGNSATFAATVKNVVGIGAASTQLGVQNSCPGCFWRIDVAPGTTINDITTGSKSATGACKTKYGSFCLDGTGYTVAKVQGIIAGLVLGLLFGAAVTGCIIWWCCVHKRATEFQGPKPVKAPAPESPATKLANQLKAENQKAKTQAKMQTIEMNATPAPAAV